MSAGFDELCSRYFTN